MGLAVSVVASAVNLVTARTLMNVGRRFRSITLEADAQLLERNQLTAHVTFGAPRLRVLGAEDARQVREVIESVALLLLLLRLLRACACARLRGCRLWRNASSA